MIQTFDAAIRTIDNYVTSFGEDVTSQSIVHVSYPNRYDLRMKKTLRGPSNPSRIRSDLVNVSIGSS